MVLLAILLHFTQNNGEIGMNWFTRKGLIFVPSSPAGWVFIAVGALYCVYAFLEIHSTSSSIGNTFVAWLFNLVLIIAALYGVAWISSSKKDGE